jgi:hypothetical protein
MLVHVVDTNACAGDTICLHQNQIVGDYCGRFWLATDRCRHAAARINEPSILPPSANGTLQGVVTSAKGESLPGATGQLVDTQIGTAPRSDGHYRIEGISTGTYDLRVRLGGHHRHHHDRERSRTDPRLCPTDPRPYRPAQLPAKAPSSRRRSGLKLLKTCRWRSHRSTGSERGQAGAHS